MFPPSNHQTSAKVLFENIQVMWKLRLLFLSLSSVLGVFTGKTGKTTMGKCGEAKMMTGTTTGWTFEPTSDQISRESAIWNSLMFFLLNLVYFVVYDKEKKSFFCCFFDKGNFIQSRKKYQVLEMSYLRRKSFCLWMFSLSNEYKIYKLTKQGFYKFWYLVIWETHFA